MSRTFYFVAPRQKVPLINEIADQFQSEGVAEKVGCVVEDKSDKSFLIQGSTSYDRIDVAPEFCPGSANGSDVSVDRGELDRLRSVYGLPFLTPFVVSDHRYDCAKRSEWIYLVKVAFGFFESIFEEFTPDVLITPEISRPFDWVPARIVSEQYGEYYWWKTTRIGSRHGIIKSSPTEEFCGLSESFKRHLNSDRVPKEDSYEYLTEVRKSGSKPGFYSNRSDSYNETLTRLVFPHGVPNPLELINLLSQRISGSSTSYDDSRLPRAKNILRRLRTRVDKVFTPPHPDDKFVFFPLHAQPEPSTRILAPMFEDQITVARQISRSIPTDHHLYVKEHPRMFRDNTRSGRYYRRLNSISGVKLLSPHQDAHRLIRDSKAVISIVGTPAMEAAFLDTPSVVFGPAHFARLSTVRKCSSLKNLSETVSWALSEPETDEEEVVAYLTAVFENTFEVPENARGSDPKSQSKLARVVAPELIDEIGCIEG